MGATRADFGGYATKAGLKCSDGKTIMPEAFKHMDGQTVPLVYQHGHTDIENVLGHGVLEAREDGMYVHGFFNKTTKGQAAKEAVEHKDLNALSIFANKLMMNGQQVLHGVIREVSLVLAGANPGAKIDWVQVQHSADPDDVTTLNDEAVIHTGLELEHEDAPASDDKKDDEGGETLAEAYENLPESAKNVVHALVQEAFDAFQKQVTAQHTDNADEGEPKADDKGDGTTDEGDLSHKEGANGMSRNVFEQSGAQGGTAEKKDLLTLKHSDVKEIVELSSKAGSLKAGLEGYALAHGIENIEVLFPDAKAISATPEWNKRRTEWVAGVLNGVGHTPFAKVKTLMADITMDEARAKGYIKGEFKKEEWFSVSKRSTGPTTIYKKQKLDRDDIIDVTDFDIVSWLWGEMRLMMEEEIARAILLGDGRDVADPDHIKDPMAAVDGDGIRSIVNEHEVFATTVNVNLDDANSSYLEAIESIIRARRFYKGTGTPTFYTTEQTLTEFLLLKDEVNSNRRLFRDVQELASYLRVANIVAVEPMEEYPDLVGIIVNLADYNIGSNRGGELTRFDDFDIDFNQYKYLMETRASGALTKMKSALVIKKTAAANVLVSPTQPQFVKSTGVVTIPTVTGVVYKDASDDSTLTAGAQPALTAGETLKVYAEPTAGYYFATNAEDEWTFKRTA
ncbi:major capsid and protease fusion protein [Streptomyces phage RosaAsantewaa]|nr:major capsid and protease fusion protein [Streptomyces phage RosaAsantewaa]